MQNDRFTADEGAWLRQHASDWQLVRSKRHTPTKEAQDRLSLLLDAITAQFLERFPSRRFEHQQGQVYNSRAEYTTTLRKRIGACLTNQRRIWTLRHGSTSTADTPPERDAEADRISTCRPPPPNVHPKLANRPRLDDVLADPTAGYMAYWLSMWSWAVEDKGSPEDQPGIVE
ncbi:hypothetical protein FS749_005935 [Ceratobasidium sp. UAMH 11750]|nr:hypothetical protein FS749_005935 [Ceratobasidium sp. UAMH 11750]